MKFSCESKDLAYAARRCSMVARIDRTFPISRYILIEADTFLGITMSATDMATSVTINIADCTVKEEGTFLADSTSLTAFVSRVGTLVNAHTTPGGKLVLKGGSNRLMLKPETSTFPEMPDVDNLMPDFELSGEALSDLMAVSIMSLRDQSFSFFAGILLAQSERKNCLISVAASSGKAAYAWVADTRAPRGFRALLPPSTPRALPACIDPDDHVFVYVIKNKVVFQTARVVLVANQLADMQKFPLAAIEDMFELEKISSAGVDAIDLKEVIETAMVMATNEKDEKFKHLLFCSDSDYRLFDVSTSEASEIGQMRLSLAVKEAVGERFEFAINGLYMKEILRLLEHFVKSNVMGSYEMAAQRERIIISLLEDEQKILMANEGATAQFLMAPIAGTVHVGMDPDEDSS